MAEQPVIKPADPKGIADGTIVYFPNLVRPWQPEQMIFYGPTFGANLHHLNAELLHTSAEAAIKHAESLLEANKALIKRNEETQ